jgi:hypothetical protein
MLSEVAPDLFCARATLPLPGGVRLPLRMSVLRLGGGQLCVHSPVPPQPGLFEAVAALGPVRHILAPNLHHHRFVGPWLARFPEARAHGAPGLARKRADLPWAGELGEGALQLPGVQSLRIEGAPGFQEVVFLHHASRSLIVSDLLFNLVPPLNAATRLLTTLTGVRGRLAMSRVWRLLVRGRAARAALASSLQRLLAWDFVRLLPAHGEVFEASDGAETVRQTRAALAWGLTGR